LPADVPWGWKFARSRSHDASPIEETRYDLQSSGHLATRARRSPAAKVPRIYPLCLVGATGSTRGYWNRHAICAIQIGTRIAHRLYGTRFALHHWHTICAFTQPSVPMA
jgi:hypothetical protein